MAKRIALLILAPFTVSALMVGLMLAQPAPDPGPEYDPPGRAAQLSFVNGTVSFQPAGAEEQSGAGDWIPAPLNRPLTTGDRLWTEGNGRAELLLGSASIRLSGRT